jgi:polyphosphate kinase
MIDRVTSTASNLPTRGSAEYADALAEDLDEARTSTDLPVDPELPTERFLDREASWLDFNRRVLELAQDRRVPLLERVRFLAIFAGNLDEFFMVRVAGLKRRLATGMARPAPSGLTAREQLDLIWTRSAELASEHAEEFTDSVVHELAEHGIEILRWSQLEADERTRMQSFFRERVQPVLTPLAVDPAHPFPYNSGLSLNLAVIVRDLESGDEHFARVKVPPLLPRFLQVGDANRFLPLEDLIAACLVELFPGMEVVEESVFRVTRNEDVEVDEDDRTENLLQALERELMRRRFGTPVRLEIEAATSDRVLDLLVRELGVAEHEVYRLPAPLDLAGLAAIAGLDRPDLAYPTFGPATHPRLEDGEGGTTNVFAALRSSDVLVQHPYDSFATSVQAFVEQAAADPRVLAIKQTLYRTSGDSPIVDALIDAARSGKQVLVVVEIKARFDEEANIKWARKLEEAGCHVVYGLVGLKTHCKLSLAVRQEPDGSLRRYAHVGTGNYNPRTARIYEDIGLLTADPVIGADIADLFNHLSGYTRQRQYRTLLVAPDTLRPRLLGLIEREMQHARAGRDASITLKMNNLVDEQVIDALYRASRAGVRVELVIRAMCALRPGVPGLSESIRVRSILGRFLEHSRIYAFGNAGDPELYIGSADAMHRNLDRRVEALVRITDPSATRRIMRVLSIATSEDLRAWELDAAGRWSRPDTGPDFQEVMIDRRHELAAGSERDDHVR